MENLFETLVEKLRKGIVSFVYRRKDGTERHACGTLYGIGHTIKGSNTHHKSKFTLAYYDVDCKGWRSFLIDNLIEVGELRKGTIAEHHDICLALVVKLKEKIKKDLFISYLFSNLSLGGLYTISIILSAIRKYLSYRTVPIALFLFASTSLHSSIRGSRIVYVCHKHMFD